MLKKSSTLSATPRRKFGKGKAHARRMLRLVRVRRMIVVPLAGFLFGAAQGRRCRPMTPLRAGALAPHKQSISLKSGDKMRVIPAFHRSSFEVGIACDFCFEDGA
jgi:hypothetical protein